MTRILRPGGKLILVGHVASSSRVARDVQRALEVITVPMASEHLLRRPLANVTQREFSIERAERFELGLIAHEFTDNSVHGFDLTFAAPKSVSLIRALTDDVAEKVLATAHTRAVHAAMEYLREHTGYTRVYNCITGNRDLP
jgi:TrwC relaxase